MTGMDMESKFEQRRRAFKATTDCERERQEEALRLQNDSREEMLNQIRVIAFASATSSKEDEMVEVEMPSKKKHEIKLKKIRKWQFFGRQFMIPDWFVEVPGNITNDWLVYVRPEGDRHLLFSDGGYTKLVRKNGRESRRRFFDARFPRGETILDGVLIEEGFICTDVLIWGDVALADAEFECRHFFLQCRLQEQDWDSGDLRLLHVEADFVSTERLEKLYESAKSMSAYHADGLQFMHKQGKYFPGLTPLALMYKDTNLSRYAVDTETEDRKPEDEVCVLQLRKGCALRTEDRHIVAHTNEETVKDIPVKGLVKCIIKDWSNGESKQLGIEVIGKAGVSRVWADSWSRLLSQHCLRIQGNVFPTILQQVAAQKDGS